MGERTEAEAAGGCNCAEVRGYPGYGRPCALQRQVPARVWDIPVVQRRRVLTVQPVLKTGDSTVLVQFWGAVDMPVVVRQALECSQCNQLWSSTVAVLWRLGRRQWGGRPGVGAHHTGDELN